MLAVNMEGVVMSKATYRNGYTYQPTRSLLFTGWELLHDLYS
jgi:hypothetical protein